MVLAEARSIGVSPQDTVVVGVSGGPDSSALFQSLDNAAQALGFNLHAAHLIHDFRGQEKYDDANFVRTLCTPVPLTVDEVDVSAYQRDTGESSFEQAARNLRYDFLASVARTVGARFIAVAHTADDQAETVLLHIARGSGVQGLRGMQKLARWPHPQPEPDLHLWRPLLDARRTDTIDYCQKKGIAYRDDSTNYMSDFARNRVRMNLMPALSEQLNPRVVEALIRLARISGVQTDYMESRVTELWPTVAPDGEQRPGVVRLRRDKLGRLHPALLPLVLRRAWASITGNNKRLTEDHLVKLSEMARASASGKTVFLPGGGVARTRSHWLELLPNPVIEHCPYPEALAPFRITLPWGPIAVGVTKRGEWEVTARTVQLPPQSDLNTGDPLSAYLSPAALAEGATVRAWEPGDRMQPLGMSGHRKLKDLFNDSGLPRDCRLKIPLVVTPHGIAWAVGVRVADWAAVNQRDHKPTDTVLLTFSMSQSPAAESDS